MFEKLFLKVYASSGQTFAESQRHDPYKNFKFLVEITGSMIFAKAGFQKVSGLKASSEVIEYREGGDQDSKRKMPGIVSYDPVTLERGMSEDTNMWDLFLKVFDVEQLHQVNDPNFRVTAVIKLLDREGKIVKAWRIDRAWASDYETGEFDAESSSVMIERIVLQHEGLTKIVG